MILFGQPIPPIVDCGVFCTFDVSGDVIEYENGDVAGEIAWEIAGM